MLTVINRRFTRWIMNQVNHKAIQHEWFMTYIVYAMNVQAHERKKRHFYKGNTEDTGSAESCFRCFFALFIISIASNVLLYRNNTGTRPYAGCKKLFT